MHEHSALAVFLLAFPALFSIVNPIAGGLIFREATADRTHAQRVALAGRVGIYSFLVMAFALWAGSFVLAFFGISMAALRIAGGLVVSLWAWHVLNAPEHREARKQDEAGEAEGVEDVAFYPLTLPFTTGPGTIAVAVALGADHPPIGLPMLWFYLGATGAAAALSAVIWVAYRYADTLADMMGQSAQRTVTRLAGFLLLCIGVQILITGVADGLEPLLHR